MICPICDAEAKITKRRSPVHVPMAEDMAEICYLRFVRYEQYMDSLTSTPETMARWRFLKGHYERWEKRWQDLADKFKGDV